MYTLLASTLLTASLFSGDTSSEIPQLSVTGTSLIKKEPDQALIRIGVQEEDKNAEEALKKTAAKITAIIAAIKANLDKEGTISTDTISLSPLYEPVNPKMPKSPSTIGYRAASSLSIKTGNLSLIGRLIDLSSKSGANQIESLTYSLKDDKSAKQEALSVATKNAIMSAKTLADAAEIGLKRILSIREDSSPGPIPYKTAYMARGTMAESSFPVEPGEVEVSASVSISYEIE